ncbi:MAG: hypothetical protein K8J09_14990 [Planctomycetes bacterium]|nr:hypothetical protein [Planctomycetota bacterium]
MRLAAYVHPFDLPALIACGNLRRLRELGFHELCLATSYHAGRWLTPWGPGRVRCLEDGVVHFRPRADYGELQPVVSSEVPADGPSPLEVCLAEATAHGLSVRAWSIGTHNSRLGLLHPRRCVHTAFGDVYHYALCPSQPAVQQYLTAMVQDLAAHPGLAAVELEAYGQLGFKHSSHHDKASFVPSGLLDAALSACFCSACSERARQAGEDLEATRRAVMGFIDAHVQRGCAMAKATMAAGGEAPEWLVGVLRRRREAAAALAAKLLSVAPGLARAVQVHPEPWFTGSQFAAAPAAVFPAADERVLTCYGDGPEAIARQLASPGMAALAASPRRLCLWPKAPAFTSDEDLVKVRDLAAAHGIGTLAIYHLGLLPWRTIERAAKMLAR